MDIELARTFLAVAATGNFVGAAARLHVTQSTISARIRLLESQLDAKLFRRGRDGAELTAAGHRFLRHAKTLVRTLEQAHAEVGLPSGFTGILTLAGRSALWHDFLPRWAGWMRADHPEVALRLEVASDEGLMQDMTQGTVDIGVMYTPESRPGLAAEYLFDESLVLVTNKPERPWPDPDYIHIDWGPEFHFQFSARVPGASPPSRTANIGWMGLPIIEAYGGSAFLPWRIVRVALEENRLWRVDEVPPVALPAYMIYPTDRENPHLAQAVGKLRALGAEERVK